MRKLILVLITLILISCQEKNSSIKPMIEKDIISLTKYFKELDALKDKGEWYEGDKEFYSYYLEGAKYELDGNFNAAIESYVKALNTTRYEMSSYEVKLALGRAYIGFGDNEKARLVLNEYKKEANEELNNNGEAEWGLSEEGIEKLKKDIQLCNQLIAITEN